MEPKRIIFHTWATWQKQDKTRTLQRGGNEREKELAEKLTGNTFND